MKKRRRRRESAAQHVEKTAVMRSIESRYAAMAQKIMKLLFWLIKCGSMKGEYVKGGYELPELPWALETEVSRLIGLSKRFIEAHK